MAVPGLQNDREGLQRCSKVLLQPALAERGVDNVGIAALRGAEGI